MVVENKMKLTLRVLIPVLLVVFMFISCDTEPTRYQVWHSNIESNC